MLWKHSKYYILFFTVFLIFIACEKENEYKNPTKVSFLIDMTTLGVGPSDNFLISNGRLKLAEFSISGQRRGAEDFEFVRSFEQALPIDLNSADYRSDLAFDLPQGEYTALNLTFTTLSDSNSLLMLGDYSYENPSKPSSSIHFSSNESMTFSLSLIDTNTSDIILLSEDDSRKIQLTFDPHFWFKEVPVPLINNANIDLINGSQVININNTSNTDINAIVLDAIGDNIHVDIE